MHYRLWIILIVMMSSCAFAQSSLRVGDVVDIRISGVPPEEVGQFSGSYTIDSEGLINIPFLGMTKAAGLQANALQQVIEGRLKSEKIYTRPTITITTGQARFVNVGGSVRSPGRVTYTADLTLTTAINAVGGFTEFADRKRVRLIREGKAITYNTLDIKKNPKLDPAVKPGDQIDVPQAGLWPF